MSQQAPIKFTFIGSDGLEKTKFVPPNFIEEFKLKYPNAQQQEGSPSIFGDNKSEIYEPGKKSGANQPQKNQQQNTDSSSENTLSDSQLVLKKSPRKGSRKNQDGTESTHLMMRAFHDGQHVAFPSLFQDDNGNWIKKLV